MDKVELRLKKIEGQVAGISRMYKEGRDCLEIAQQAAAARSALAQVVKIIVSGEAVKCSACKNEKKSFEKMLSKILALS